MFMKKKINKEFIQKILDKLPLETRKKIIDSHKQGKKVSIKIKSKKNGVKSPYQKKKGE